MQNFENNKNQNNKNQPEPSQFQNFVRRNKEELRGKSKEEIASLYRQNQELRQTEYLRDHSREIQGKRAIDEFMAFTNPEKVQYFREKIQEYKDAGKDYKRLCEALEFEFEQRHNGVHEWHNDDMMIWQESDFPIKVGEIPHARAAAQELLTQEKLERLESEEVTVQFDDIFDQTWLGKLDKESHMIGGYENLIASIESLKGQSKKDGFHKVDIDSTTLKIPIGKEQEMISYIKEVRDTSAEKLQQMKQRIKRKRLFHLKTAVGKDLANRKEVQEMYLKAMDDIVGKKSRGVQIYSPKNPDIAIGDHGFLGRKVNRIFTDTEDMYKAVEAINPYLEDLKKVEQQPNYDVNLKKIRERVNSILEEDNMDTFKSLQKQPSLLDETIEKVKRGVQILEETKPDLDTRHPLDEDGYGWNIPFGDLKQTLVELEDARTTLNNTIEFIEADLKMRNEFTVSKEKYVNLTSEEKDVFLKELSSIQENILQDKRVVNTYKNSEFYGDYIVIEGDIEQALFYQLVNEENEAEVMRRLNLSEDELEARPALKKNKKERTVLTDQLKEGSYEAIAPLEERVVSFIQNQGYDKYSNAAQNKSLREMRKFIELSNTNATRNFKEPQNIKIELEHATLKITSNEKEQVLRMIHEIEGAMQHTAKEIEVKLIIGRNKLINSSQYSDLTDTQKSNLLNSLQEVQEQWISDKSVFEYSDDELLNKEAFSEKIIEESLNSAGI